MSKSDFLTWDGDLDLEELLGEYTDFDNLELGSDSDFEIVESPRKRQKCNSKASKSVIYTCPVCFKKLKTISGFRGHTSRQHGKNELKASDYRNVDSSADVEVNRNSTEANSNTTCTSKSCFNPEEFRGIFHKAYNSSVCSLLDDELNKFLGGDEFVSLCKFTQQSKSVEEFLCDRFLNLFEGTGMEISSVLDREQLFRKLHSLRLDGNMRQNYLNLYSDVAEVSSVNSFMQTFLLNLLEKILSEQVVLLTKISSEKQVQISDSDQKVLMYVCGSVIRALSRKYTRTAKHELCVKAVRLLENQNSASTFLSKYKTWINIKDKGGLKCPSDNFYLLVRELEIIVRNKVNFDSLSASSLTKDPLVETIMENFMIKHYLTKVFEDGGHDVQSVATKVFEDIIQLFLTIRGFATVRLERNKLAKKIAQDSKKNCKTSSNLRGQLK